MAILISIDHGNDSIKTENYRFRSGLVEHKAVPLSRDDVLEYEDTYYTLSNERIPYMRDKTQDDRFFILTLFAIAKELVHEGPFYPTVEVELDLGVGLPPEHIGILRDKFERYFKRGKVEFVYDGKPFIINIRHVIVCPQAYAAVLALGREIAEMPRVFIIDGGGYTFDIGLLNNGRPDMKFNRSLEAGTITMYNEVARLVNAKHDMAIGEDRILEVLQANGNVMRLPEDVIKTIRDTADNYASDVLHKLREIQVDLRSNPSVFMGGASKLYRPIFEGSKMVLDAQYIDDPKCNVYGFRLMAESRIKKLSV